jgi:hypothetical protein
MANPKEATMTSKQTEKPPTPDPVELARADVQRLNQQELELSRLYHRKARELAEARARRGDDVLAANDPGAAARESSRQISEKVEELAALGDAAAAARRQRLAAIPAVFKAEAGALERQGAQLDIDAAANEAAVRDALKAVETIADCPYAPRAPQMPDRAVGPGQQGVGSIPMFIRPTPLFQRLRLRAEGLRLEAAQRRLQEPHAAGSVEAESLEQLVDVVFADAMRVGPSVDQISGWYEQAVEKVRRRRQQLELDDVPINVVHLQWVRGQIDIAASFVSSSTQSTPGVQTIDTDADFAAAAATETQPQASKPHAPKNVIYGGSATGKQEVDLDDEYARAAATEQR